MMNRFLKWVFPIDKFPIENINPALKLLAALPLVFLLMSIRSGDLLDQMPDPEVVIRSKSGATITFYEKNGKSDHNDPKKEELPQLVLFRNGKLTDPQERTLEIELRSLDLPSTGGYVSIEAYTGSAGIKLSGQEKFPITVWMDTWWVPPQDMNESEEQGLVITYEFTENINLDGVEVLTPTDYFHLNLSISQTAPPAGELLFNYSKDFAFLMESQWFAELPEVLEDSPGSAPRELVVYYCDMFFPNIQGSSNPWIPRQEINRYLSMELIPAMLAAYQAESVSWGYPWYAEWRPYREDESRDLLSVALTKDDTWFHGVAPEVGNASISINLQNAELESYNNLSESVISNFYHELFHHHQRNINLHLGSDGDIDGSEEVWQFFSEGSAVLATSVGQTEVQFSSSPGLRSYLINANGYLAGGGPVVRDIHKSFQDINPYHAAIYWRFLYEKCGEVSPATQNPQAGMQLIRNVLTILYSSEIVDIRESSAFIEHFAYIMDLALSRTDMCPFDNFVDSLNGFARDIYSLKLENGRCAEPGKPQGCGFYDPDNLYLELPIEKIKFNSEVVVYEPSGRLDPEEIADHGIRFIEVEFGQTLQGRPLNLELLFTKNAYASYCIQILNLDVHNNTSYLVDSVATVQSSNQLQQDENIKMEYLIPEIDLQDYNQLAVIITRVDSGNPGSYILNLNSNFE
jgi:hypothetical protein